MLLDNAASHAIAGMEKSKVGNFDSLNLSNLLLIFMPTNCTAIIQPLDQGVIAAFKACYKSKLANHMVAQYSIDFDLDLRSLSLKTDIKQVCCFWPITLKMHTRVIHVST